MRWIRTALIAGVAAFVATVAAAQSGGIRVLVKDDQGSPLPGATVTIGHETGFVKTTAALSDKDGVAEFPVLRAGAGYSIEVAFPGFNTIREDGIRVKINETQTLPVQMMEEFQERVKVVAQTEVIDLDKTETTTRFSENFISDLPVPGRFYQNVLTMAPGVQDADGDGNPNVHGSRSRDFQAVVSGVSNVDPLTGQWMSRINPNSIEEMEVITAGAGVEFGRAQGGFANVIQKQGGNNLEGVVEFYYRTSKLDGDGAVKTSAISHPNFDWYQPSVQVSGPIIKDKLWYRASLEHRDVEQPVNVASGLEVTTIKEDTNDFQVTWQVSPRNKLALQYRQDPRTVGNFGVSSLTNSTSSLGLDRETQTTTVIWTAPFSPKVLVESTASWQDLKTAVFPNTVGFDNDCVAGADFLQSAQCFNSETGQITGSFATNRDDHRQRLTVKGKATVYGGRFWGMSHQFKLGLSIENERYFRKLTQRPTMAFFIVADPSEDTTGQGGQLEPFGIAIVSLAVPETDAVRATGANWGVYAEDQFKPRQNLTLTVGARVDREEIGSEGRELFDPQAELDAFLAELAQIDNPTSEQIHDAVSVFTGYEDFESFKANLTGKLCGDGDSPCKTEITQSINSLNSWQLDLDRVRRSSDLNIANTNISPYLSIAWDPSNNAKMALRASAGRHYNNIPLLIPLTQLEPAQTDLLYRVDLGGDDAGNISLLNGISPAVNVSMVDPDLRTPYQDEFTFSFERELWAETSLTLTYINRKFRDQIQDRNINVGSGDYGACVLQVKPDDPTLVQSWGEGATLVDPTTRELYTDTDPGPGDGRIDDCTGDTIDYRDSAGGDDGTGNETNFGAVQRPDGIVDLYKLNPFWGDIYVIGNFNQIDYEGYQLELVRRQYRSWELQGSYVFSKAKGDGEDFFQGFDDDPTVEAFDVKGYQAYDQRHVVKLNATTITPWGVRLGTSVSWQSGLPYSLLFRRPSFDTLTPSTAQMGVTGARSRFSYPTGARNDQRNDSYWNVDLKATKELNLARGLNLQLSAEVFNVLDDGTYTIYNTGLERGIQVNGTNEAYYRFGREWQLGMKLAF